MRVLIDYRPALRARTGVGEYVHQVTRALLASFSPCLRAAAPCHWLDLTLFSSSWKDRLFADQEIERARLVDRRLPVTLMNLAWHRLEWPSAEVMTGASFDVAHSPHPLLLPTRSAAQVITVHDLYFMTHPEQTHAEVRRDYPALARRHAQRADRIVVPSQFTANEVQCLLDVPADRISVCPHGRPPGWEPRRAPPTDGGYVLFIGTLEARKNVGGLLDAWERMIDPPQLILAGSAPTDAQPLLDRMTRQPLAGSVRHVGYVDPARRRDLYEGARLLVQPSFEEGFGFPVLEAMTLGIPVVAANRGALPEVLGDCGLLVDPADPEAMATAMTQLLEDDQLAAACAAKGVIRSRLFDWQHTAQSVYRAYQLAIDHRQCASA